MHKPNGNLLLAVVDQPASMLMGFRIAVKVSSFHAMRLRVRADVASAR